MAKDYIEKRESGYYVIGSRITIDSIVSCFLNGDSPETIRTCFPALSLEQVYGALAFYLANRPMIDAYLAQADLDYEKMRLEARAKDPALYERLRAIVEGKRATQS